MNDWLQYDWKVHGDPAAFLVNMAYADEWPGEYDTLFYCAAAPISEDAACFTGGEYKRLARVESKLKKILSNALYVGYIHMDALRQYYFYVKEQDEALEAAEAYMGSEKKLHLSSGVSPEPDWLTYHMLLLPDAAKYQTVFNAQLIERQRAAGDALEKARRLTFLVCFPTDQQRQLFTEAARKAGFALGDPEFQPELPLSHVQALYAVCALDKRDMDELTTRAIRAAEPYGGEFLRWTCPKMAKKNPLA